MIIHNAQQPLADAHELLAKYDEMNAAARLQNGPVILAEVQARAALASAASLANLATAVLALAGHTIGGESDADPPPDMPHHEDIDAFAEIAARTVLAPPCNWPHHSHAAHCDGDQAAEYVIRSRPHPGEQAIYLLVCEARMIWLRMHWAVEAIYPCKKCGGRTLAAHFDALGRIDVYQP